MRHHPRLLLLLLTPIFGGCNAMGGAEDPGGGAEATFELVSGSPKDGAPSAPVGATITLTFSSPIDETSVTSSTLLANHPLFGTLTVDGPTLTFDPAGDLLPTTTYVFEISPELKGINGHALGHMENPYGFKTSGSTTPEEPPISGPRPR